MDAEEIKEAIQHCKDMKKALRQSLHVLELQAVRFGNLVPPHIKIDVDDINEKIHHQDKKMQLLNEQLFVIEEENRQQILNEEINLRDLMLQKLHSEEVILRHEMMRRLSYEENDLINTMMRQLDVKSKLEWEKIVRQLNRMKNAYLKNNTLEDVDIVLNKGICRICQSINIPTDIFCEVCGEKLPIIDRIDDGSSKLDY
jgi:hypothetical protein